MDEKSIEVRAVLKYLILKGNDNDEILDELHDVYGEDCISLRTIQGRRKSIADGTFSILDKPRSGRPPITQFDDKIENMLSEDPSISAKTIAEKLNISRATVKTIIVERLHMHKVNFKWVPYELTPQIRKKRVEIAEKLLAFFESASKITLNSVYTEDETWIYYDNPRTSMWILNGSERPKIPKKTIKSKKVMISVFWSRQGIKTIVPLPEDTKFDKEFFRDNVVKKLLQNDDRKHKIFHFDNARPHLIDDYLKKKKITKLPHPPYSPDLAPSDFFLFGYLKMKLEGWTFKTEKGLLKKINSILYEIPKEMFQNAFKEWKLRLNEVIRRGGDYL